MAARRGRLAGCTTRAPLGETLNPCRSEMPASIRRLQVNRSTTPLRQNSPDTARLALAIVGETGAGLP